MACAVMIEFNAQPIYLTVHNAGGSSSCCVPRPTYVGGIDGDCSEDCPDRIDEDDIVDVPHFKFVVAFFSTFPRFSVSSFFRFSRN